MKRIVHLPGAQLAIARLSGSSIPLDNWPTSGWPIRASPTMTASNRRRVLQQATTLPYSISTPSDRHWAMSRPFICGSASADSSGVGTSMAYGIRSSFSGLRRHWTSNVPLGWSIFHHCHQPGNMQRQADNNLTVSISITSMR
jgi:hypothetical protein